MERSISIGSYISLLVGALLFSPTSAFAQVVISEIMYDPAGTDTGNEWVEIFNASGSAVDITGWKINDGSNHVFNEPPENGSKGSMSIPSGGYLILASDASLFANAYPSASNVIDTVLAMNNTGDTVSLVNADGTTVDTVSYIESSGAAGDGNSLHRGSAGSGTLIPASPTPSTGTLVASASSNTSTAQSATTTSQQTQTQSSSSGYTFESNMLAFAGEDRAVIVGADTIFEAKAATKAGEPMGPLGVRFVWNFGDGKAIEGSRVLHAFAHPGRYVVTLNASADTHSATDRVIVTAKPAAFALATLPDGSAVIENTDSTDLDLSLWMIKSSEHIFHIPEDTVVLTNERIIIPPASLGFEAVAGFALLYPNGSVAIATLPAKPAIIHAPAAQPKASAQAKEAPRAVPSAPASVVETEPVEEPELQLRAAAAAATPIQAQEDGIINMWTIALVALIAIGATGAYFASRTSGTAGNKEWDIQEIA